MSKIKQFSKNIEINNISVYCKFYHYECNKPVIIFIHGFLSSSFCYRNLLHTFDETFTLVVLDIPPFGKSGKHKNFVYSYKNFGFIIQEVINKFQLRNVTLVGHSMGGQIVLHCMLIGHKEIKRCVLLNSSGYLYQPKKFIYYSTYIPFFHLYIKHWITKNGVEDILSKIVYNKKIINEEMKNGYMQPFFEKKIFKALTKMIRDREGDLRSEELVNIQLPVLLLWGDNDRVIPPSIGKQLARDLPNSTFILFKNAGHLLPEERPNDVYYQINEFIKTS